MRQLHYCRSNTLDLKRWSLSTYFLSCLGLIVFSNTKLPTKSRSSGNSSVNLQLPTLTDWCDWCADVTVTVEGFGEVTVDISYGGAFYALVDAQRFNLDVTQSRTRDLVVAATAVTAAVKSQVKIRGLGLR